MKTDKNNRISRLSILTFLIISAILMLSSCSSNAAQQKPKIGNPYLQKLADEKNSAPVAAIIKDGIQQIDMNIYSDRYEPSVIKLKKGLPAKFNIKSIDNFGCGRTLVMPSIKVYKELPENGEVVLEALPDKVGEGPITCSMGMFSGKVIVEE
ncbi:cupredoxin domain-containing protein [Candidatus Woesearchaeota archaeon]|nr:cupredoxin domain-containing protein [Candidatus Woesearchaeota archaeon]